MLRQSSPYRCLRVLAVFISLSCAGASGQIDENANGLGDVWETAYATALLPNDDADGDSFTNREESAAGTDALDSRAFPKIRHLAVESANRLRPTWPTVAGICYQTMVSRDMLSWMPVGPAVIGTGEEHEQLLDATSILTSGKIRRTRWNTNTWNLDMVKSFVTSPNPPAPSIDDTLSRLEIPQSDPDSDDYSQWLRGWIVAPQTGNYSFWLASDDHSELWLSPSKNPSAKTRICTVDGWTTVGQWDKYPTQRSAVIPLTAGQSYYFEIYHREGSGGDHLAVAWTRPGMAEGAREIISGSALASSSIPASRSKTYRQRW
jgi:hypothetical protein